MELYLSSLVRRVHHEIRRRLLDELRARGYHDITQAHLYVFQRPGPDGCRPTELAQRTIVTKQAMNHLLAGLESGGYLRRLPDPHDGRGTVVRLTPKGRKLTNLVHRTASAIEHEWAEQLGPARMDELLVLLHEVDEIARVPAV
ncbi:MAG TPA: MarR family transcriptional regulator, partial [Acidimicrobiia bacterium]|nr:MarR family transcriptional regulator [Acidimicrobiia bacterium]